MTGVRDTGGLTLRRCTDAHAWDQLVASHAGATPFHSSAFLATAGRSLGLRVRLAIAERNGEVVGAVPLLFDVRGPFALVNHNLPFPYVGPLLTGGVGVADVLPAVRRLLRGWILLSFDVQSVDPFPPPEGAGWGYEGGYESAFVKLAGVDDDALLERMHRNHQRNVRKGLRKGLQTGPATREEIAGFLSGWVAEPFARQSLPPRWPDGAHLALYDALEPRGLALATAVRADGELVGLSLDLLAGSRAVGWESGVGERGRALSATPVLQFAAMRAARDRGAVEFDMLGSPNEGIARYKRHLGAEFRPRGIARWRSPLLPLGKRLVHRPARLLQMAGR